MTIGTIYYIGKQGYVVVNSSGTQEKLPPIRWIARAYLEIRQGLDKNLPLPELRRFIERWRI
jgi:hypothetical protein